MVILVNVYVYNSSGENKILFFNILEAVAQIKSKFHTHLVLIGGDFNLAPDLAGQISLVIQATISITLFRIFAI